MVENEKYIEDYSVRLFPLLNQNQSKDQLINFQNTFIKSEAKLWMAPEPKDIIQTFCNVNVV